MEVFSEVLRQKHREEREVARQRSLSRGSRKNSWDGSVRAGVVTGYAGLNVENEAVRSAR